SSRTSNLFPAGGFRLWPGGLHPLKAPFSPQNSSGLSTPGKTPDESTWGSPLRRTLTLANGFPHATKNCPAHSSGRTISAMCCVKNTQSPGVFALECALNINTNCYLQSMAYSTVPSATVSGDAFAATRAHPSAIGDVRLLGIFRT